MGWMGIHLVLLFLLQFSSLAWGMGPKSIDQRISAELAQSQKIISDEIVENLSCSSLQNGVWPGREVFRKETFSRKKNLPLSNWSGLVLGRCWSIARAQRLFFYLARTDLKHAWQNNTGKEFILDQVRSTRALPFSKVGPVEIAVEPDVFGIDSWPLQSDRGLWLDLLNGIPTATGRRTVISDLEYSQRARFFRIENLIYTSGNRARPKSENENTALQLHHDLKAGKMPMIIVRAGLMSQHVMLVKDIFYLTGRIQFSVYDSNYPDAETIVYFENGQFYAPSYNGGEPYSPVGIFIADDDEMQQIILALTKFYIKRCLRPE